jgi:hypothetical protein
MKTCQKCKQEKPFGDFYRCSSRSDGLQTRCKACQNEETRRRMARPHNKKKQAARTLAHQKAHRDQFNKYRREWAKRSYAKDPKKWQEASDKYMERMRAILGDAYVKALIAKQVGCKRGEVPAELVSAKRAYIATKRLIQEKAK